MLNVTHSSKRAYTLPAKVHSWLWVLIRTLGYDRGIGWTPFAIENIPYLRARPRISPYWEHPTSREQSFFASIVDYESI